MRAEAHARFQGQQANRNTRWSPFCFNKTPLHIAAEFNAINAVAGILSVDDSFVDAVDQKNRTALHYAAMNGYYKPIVLLHQHRANTEIADSGGKTPSACIGGSYRHAVSVCIQTGTVPDPLVPLADQSSSQQNQGGADGGRHCIVI